jgi:hypothetical protein
VRVVAGSVACRCRRTNVEAEFFKVHDVSHNRKKEYLGSWIADVRVVVFCGFVGLVVVVMKSPRTASGCYHTSVWQHDSAVPEVSRIRGCVSQFVTALF